jgi:RNA polymerase sigma factor (sigma-70 family)
MSSSKKIGENGPQLDGALQKPTPEEFDGTRAANPQSAPAPQEIAGPAEAHASNVLPEQVAQECGGNVDLKHIAQECMEFRPILMRQLIRKFKFRNELVEDIASDALLKVIKRAKDLDKEPIEAILGYYAIVARNLAYDVQKQKAKVYSEALSLDNEALEVEQYDNDEWADAKRIMESVETAQMKERIMNARNNLPQKQKDLFDMFIMFMRQGLTLEEIAMKLEVTPRTVVNRINKLADKLQQEVRRQM